LMLLSAAKTWTFRPALRDGRPVKFRLRITVPSTNPWPFRCARVHPGAIAHPIAAFGRRTTRPPGSSSRQRTGHGRLSASRLGRGLVILQQRRI